MWFRTKCQSVWSPWVAIKVDVSADGNGLTGRYKITNLNTENRVVTEGGRPTDLTRIEE